MKRLKRSSESDEDLKFSRTHPDPERVSLAPAQRFHELMAATKKPFAKPPFTGGLKLRKVQAR